MSTTRRIEAVSPCLERIRPGRKQRWQALFDSVRLWAYEQAPMLDQDQWVRAVIAYAHAQNQRFPVPIDCHKAQNIGYSVAQYVWENNWAFKLSRRQRWRGIMRYYGPDRTVTPASLDARNSAIRRDLAAGMPVRAVARRHSISPTTVRRVRDRA